MSDRIWDQLVDAPMLQEQEPVCNRTVEQNVNVKFQETVEVNMATPQERILERILARTEVDSVRQI